MKKKHWYDYFWVWSILYFALGFFNILFAWLGMLDFFLPLGLALFGGNKFFCNHLCGRGQLFSKLGKEGKCSMKSADASVDVLPLVPLWLSGLFSGDVREHALQTYLVGAGAASLREAIKLFWTFRVPWGWTYTAGMVPDWVAQFSFGFYGLMLTSLLLGIFVMILYKPRSWCVFCRWGR